MGLESYVVPFGRDTASVVYVLNFAVRAALMYGGLRPVTRRLCRLRQKQGAAFVLLLGGVDAIKQQPAEEHWRQGAYNNGS